MSLPLSCVFGAVDAAMRPVVTGGGARIHGGDAAAGRRRAALPRRLRRPSGL